MQKRTRNIALTASMAVACIALGATIASAANSSSSAVPALQSTSGRYVFACVNPDGGIDYLEFRAPLPHQCWFAGESLWYWDAVPLAQPGTYPTYPVYSPTPTASATTSPAGDPMIANVETTPLDYTTASTALAITSALTLSDADDTSATPITGATVSISAGFSSSADTLAFTNANGITGSYDATTGVLTLTGSASLADYQTALTSVTFSTTTVTATLATRTISFTVTDSTSAVSNTESRTIDVQTVTT
jgi:hypothetical protein